MFIATSHLIAKKKKKVATNLNLHQRGLMNYILKVNANQLITARVIGVYILIYKSMHTIFRGKSKLQNSICGMISFI